MTRTQTDVTAAVPAPGPGEPGNRPSEPSWAPAITVIGCDGRPPPAAAAAALAAASRVAGARRHLDAVPLPPGVQRIEITSLGAALDAICGGRGTVAVLASGDPGFFGIVRALRARGVTPRVIPAASSVALAFGLLGLDWDDALVLSAHGRDVRPVRAAALAHPKVAILTGPPEEEMRQLRRDLFAAGKKVYAAERLGAPDERVRDLSGDPAGQAPENPHVLIALDPAAASAAGTSRWLAGHRGAPSGWALEEDAFAHRDSMITKSEVRALVLAKLGPGPGRTIWDVGAGSGSVAVECARFGAWAVAIDSDPAQCARIRQNAARHGVRLRVEEGRVPRALRGLPEPDAIFAGGGDDEALAAVMRAGRPERVVVTLASVDRVRRTCELLTGLGYEAGGTQLQAARLAGLPGGSIRLSAVNPVFVIWGAAVAGDAPGERPGQAEARGRGHGRRGRGDAAAACQDTGARK